MMNTKPITVFYDGSCPLCLREISMYRKLNPIKPVNWFDVSDKDPQHSGVSLSQCKAMERFHVMDSDGDLHSGAAGFSLLWQNYSGWRYLGYICSLPVIKQLAELAYRGFLVIRPSIQKLTRKLVD